MVPRNLCVCLSFVFHKLLSQLKQSTWWINQYPWKENDRRNGWAQKRQKAACHINTIQIQRASRVQGTKKGYRRGQLTVPLGMVPSRLILGYVPSPWAAAKSVQCWLYYSVPLELGVSLLPFTDEAMNGVFSSKFWTELGHLFSFVACQFLHSASSTPLAWLPLAFGGSKPAASRSPS